MNPLFAVRDCLRDRQLASAAEIAACVQVSTPIAEDMLAHWVQRGLIERIDAQGGVCSSGSCGSCGLCGARKTAALYQWRGSKPDATPTPAARVLMLRSA
ncbi:FeoC-like transcriptional regulator [Thiomonas sp.]